MADDQPVNRFRLVLKSLNCDGWQGVALLLACGALLLPLLGGEPLELLLRYDRQGLAEGQWWRLLTGHLVHLDPDHALLNAIGLVLLWALFAGLQGWRETLLVVLVSLAAIDVGFWFLQPRLAWYVGASGVLHGLMAAGTLKLFLQRDRIALPTALLFAGKLAWEQTHGPLPFETQATVIVSAHLYGALGGLLAGALSCARRLAIMRVQQGGVEHV
jgi:rhomboid family GlyGly-CTERM serine protease